MCKLVLNYGDKVRNINNQSKRKGWLGLVSKVGDNYYDVIYANGEVQTYCKQYAHTYIEKVVEECPCHNSDIVIDFGTAYRDVSMMKPETRDNYMRAHLSLSGVKVETEPKRRVIKKVRRNVITGKTQDDYVRELGHVKGVQQFNTRALGKSTGQALHAIGCAMTNPGTEIRISHIDHAKDNPLCSTSWTTLDRHFRKLVQSLIGDMKGFSITDTHIVFNPIVTEETYVEL